MGRRNWRMECVGVIAGLLLAGCGPAEEEVSPWSEPERISDAQNSFEPSAAAHPAGIHLVWLQGNSAIRARHFDIHSNHWERTRDLGPANGEPAVAADAAGNAVVIWTDEGKELAPEDDELQAVRYDRETDAWSEASLLDVAADRPDVVMDAEGNALALWTHWPDGEEPQLYSARMTADGTWSRAEPIEGTTGSVSYTVELVLHADGGATAFLRREFIGDDGYLETELVALRTVGDGRSLAEGVWTQPVAMQVAADWQDTGLSLAGNARGDAAVFWVHNTSEDAAIYTASSAAASGDTWTEPDRFTGLSSCDGAISMDGAGHAIVACSDTRTSGTELNAIRLNSEGGFGAVERISPQKYAHASDPAVLALDDRVLVAWSEGDGTDKFAMRSSTFRDGSWQAPELVGPIADGIPQPKLVAIPDVGVLAYWSTLDDVMISWHP